MESPLRLIERYFGRMIIMGLAMTNAIAQQDVPTLRYDPPPNFYRSAITPPEDYSSNEFNATLQVYPFRPFNGNIEQMFQKTLLRERIDPRYQEINVAGPPDFRVASAPGAEAVLTARFSENIAGILKEHMGTKPKYVADPNRPAGYGSHVPARHYYLFSADGRVYCAYDALPAPGGDINRFDFDAAQRADPVNSGRYTVKGNQLHIQMGSKPEPITTAMPKGNRLEIETVTYVRQ